MFSTNTSVQGKEQANKLQYHTSHITEDIVGHVCQMSLPSTNSSGHFVSLMVRHILQRTCSTWKNSNELMERTQMCSGQRTTQIHNGKQSKASWVPATQTAISSRTTFAFMQLTVRTFLYHKAEVVTALDTQPRFTQTVVRKQGTMSTVENADFPPFVSSLAYHDCI